MGESGSQAAPAYRRILFCLSLSCVFLSPVRVSGQQPTGTMTGVVTDPSGAVVAHAGVTVINKATNQRLGLTTTAAGAYTAAGLLPGTYEVRIEARGFRPALLELTVEVGRVSSADVRLQVGATGEAVTVRADEVRVNLTQSSLEGVVSERLIRDLPLNGRNFLELGQLEPGAQVNDGSTVVVANSFRTVLGVAGQSGILTRVTLDGVDLTDEHWGSLTANISQDAIREFQVSRSALDPSTGLAANGAVNVVTKSGGNELHGTGFLFWRDDALAARIGDEATPFDREQFGISLGGPLRRDRLFWFASYEQTNQDAAVSTFIPVFPQFSKTWPQPFDEELTLARMDANLTRSIRLFGRFLYDELQGLPTGYYFGGTALSPIVVEDNTAQSMGALEATHGRFTQCVRFAYLRYSNFKNEASGLIPEFPRGVDPQGRPMGVGFGGGALAGFPKVGANSNVPMRRLQDSYESRYDASYSFGRHTLRWGFLDNVIRTNWFESLSHSPQVTVQYTAATQAACGDRPLCYPVQSVSIGNQRGWLTEVPTHGLPFGGFKNHRLHWYVADTWRINPRLTLNAGLRYVYEPGANAPDLAAPEVLEQFAPGLSAPSPRDKNNFAPQLGLAFDPTGSGKWVLRANAGLFYDMKIIKDTWWVRSNLIGGGIGGGFQNLSNNPLRDPDTNAVIFDLDGSSPAPITSGCNWLGQPIGAGPGPPGSPCTISFLDALFQAADLFYAAAAAQAEKFPDGISVCERNRNCQVFGPNYRTPYTLQFSVGVQRELRPGLVLAVDFVRHRGLHYLLRSDLNRQGAADTFREARALAAMNVTFGQFSSGGIRCNNAAFPTLSDKVDCTIAAGATIDSYAINGVGVGGGAAAATGSSPFAFPGDNLFFNRVQVHFMNGNTAYNALQVQLRGRLPDLGGLKNGTLVASYALSRMKGTSEDQALMWVQTDNLKQRLYGPTNLDRTHILSVASGFDIPLGLRLNSIWRVSSSLPQTLYVPNNGMTAQAGIFRTDLDGDGLDQDLLPGTGRGSYGRDIGCGADAINRYIDQYNADHAGQLTPAGRTLVDADLFTEQQLAQLDAVSPALSRAPAGQVCLDSFITTDVRISRPVKLGERFTLEPALEWFNLFNIANHDMPADKLQGLLTGLTGSLNGTTAANRLNRASYSGGTNSLGAARSWQLSVRVTF